ncbi:type II secretion system F family protein [Sulfurihydrogenibium subterraneum]|uniref:type II secretion system F family protein n=1 Tax=Sulfurihydrogenibium subterraneum TaxID=171121 RepID=UPI00048CAB06|nr:type II secretion system F family protein [Sulfurihydrogenibium subterraneum]
MTEYYYEGYLQGSKVKGSIQATDKLQALKKLKEEGIIPTLITEKEKGFNLNLFNKPSDDEVAFVLMQMYTLLKNGIPITKVLELVSSQTENKTLSSELIKIKSSVESGRSLSDAFKESNAFPPFLSVMLQSAQTGENLEFVFKVSSEFILKVSQIKSKIISSLIYPSVIILFSIVSIFIAVKFVVPKITAVLENFGKEPPFITKLMVYFSKVLTVIFYLTPFFILGFIFKHKLISKEKYDKFLLSIPVVGKVILYFNLTRFSQVLQMTLQTNTPIQTAVKLSINSLSNEYLKQSLKDLPEKIEKGSSISKALSDIKILPPLFINLIQTGEASGEIESMLQTISKVYEDLTEKVIQRWISFIEPAMMLIIGVIIAIIVISVILPITEISAGKLK